MPIANDPITLEIIQSSLQSTADEMFAAMKKTAMSSIIYEVLDMGTGITDSEGEIACSGAGIPGFVGVLDKAVKVISAKFDAPDEIEPGDVFTTNDPYHGGVTHLNDIVVAMPVFTRGRIIAWTANIAHNSDVGGMAPGSLSGEATEIFQEGLRLPAVKIVSRGEPIRPVMEIMKANSRMPDVLEGDVWAAIASVRIGAARLVEIAEKYGAATFERAMGAFMDYGEQVSRAELAKLPKGSFALFAKQDDGQIFNVKTTISDAEFVVDLRDNPDQAANPLNTSQDGVMVSAQMIFKSLTDPHSPCNAGSFRPIRLLTRKGSVFDAREPAPLGFYYEIDLRAYDLMWRCLAQSMPERLAAGHFTSVCRTFIGGVHPDTGRQYTIIEPQLGGWGARHGCDGNHAMFSGVYGETFNCPAEINEARNGLHVDRMTLNLEPGGEGRFTGGRGIVMDYRVRADDGFLTAGYTRSRVSGMGARRRPRGLAQLHRVHPPGGRASTIRVRLRPRHPEGRCDPHGNRKRRRPRRSEATRPRAGAPRCRKRPAHAGTCPGDLRSRRLIAGVPEIPERSRRVSNSPKEGLNKPGVGGHEVRCVRL